MDNLCDCGVLALVPYMEAPNKWRLAYTVFRRPDAYSAPAPILREEIRRRPFIVCINSKCPNEGVPQEQP